MVDRKVMIAVTTGSEVRRPDFYDYMNILKKSSNDILAYSHDRSPAHGRNVLIEEAIKWNCSHILFVDDDQAFKPEALNQLLEHDKDIVSGLYLTRSYPHQPLIFDVADDTGACLYAYLDPEQGRLKEVVAAGFGFLLCKIEIFKKLEKPWVRLGELDSEQWCDDIGFFNRVRQAGIRSYCDLECLIGHMGNMIIWPIKNEQGWFTGYDTGGSGQVSTPQINPSLLKV